MSEQEVTAAANVVAAERDAAVILYNGPIDYYGFGGLLRALQVTDDRPRRTHALLILSTLGGSANAGYQIARALQQGFTSFSLYVPHRCKSAGTLVSLGANEVIMDDIAELGPLDVQLIQRDEIGRRRSGLILRNAFDGLSQATLEAFEKVMLGIKAGSGGVVSFDTASRIAAEIASQVMAPVYAQISPEALGNDLRDLNIATEYGNRLVNVSQNADSRAVDRLVHHYPAHDFIIDRGEAAQLFKTVVSPSDNLVKLTMLLGEAVYMMRDESIVVRLDRELEESADARFETEPEAEVARSVVDDGLQGAGDSDSTGGGKGKGGRTC